MSATTNRLDFSCAAATNQSAYRRLTVAVRKIDAGPGPSVALIAGVHGDEWEGQAALLDLWHRLPGILRRGTVYVVPAANVEASMAGTRLSPSDSGNLNRAFQGEPVRGYTEAVAAALETRILAHVEYMIDVHSGGTSLRYVPSSVVTRYATDAYDPRVAGLAKAFGLPHCLYFHGTETSSMPAAASRHGVVRLSAEIGGAAESTQTLVDQCRDGLLSSLAHLGMLDPRHALSTPAPALYNLDPPSATLRAHDRGVFIPGVALGEHVQAGQALGQMIEPSQPDLPARLLAAPSAGMVVCLRPIARSDAGDCLVQIAPALAFESLSHLY